ncbi:hypothetical protein [Vibrio anguillarum]|uniref:Uncharacterized protein n=4 Tax=Vibrio anguillarum TaxID=55601 RepID=A0A7U6J4R8_VIBAN|nr:hypothetical protein [Vibrio anguillarum]AZS26374.1 hypothetical protein DYL72_15840 [Vibrio anguillarum]MBF4374500.1 hypothetical protein [Vibrio anguillarum]
MDIYEDKLDKAVVAFNEGFTSQAAKKRTFDLINCAYDFLKTQFQDEILALRNQATDDGKKNELTELYWSIPYLHNWKDKHDSLFSLYPSFIEKMNKLVSLRLAVKESEILPSMKAKTDIDKKTEQVHQTVAEIMEKRRQQYVEGLELAQLFNGLNVSVNAHEVVNDKGTRFIRYFFYLNGKLTALNMIMAIAYEHHKPAV